MEGRDKIKTTHLTKRYPGQTAVEDLNLEVGEGEIFGFLGPNGAGKTTTLLMLMGLTQPTSGSATVAGFNPSRQARKIKQQVGYLPENVGFYGDLNAVENLAYVTDLNGMKKAAAAARISELLDLVGLKEAAHKKVGAFSRGMRQRLGFAEILIKDPTILFLDEPTLGLDPDGSLRLMDLVHTLNRDRNMTVILSSHNLHQVQKISHRVGIMINGKMVAQGPIENLARAKFGIQEKEYSLEDIYMKYFREV